VSARLECRVSVADDASALSCLAPVPDIGNAADVETEDGQLTTDSSDSDDDVLDDGFDAEAAEDATTVAAARPRTGGGGRRRQGVARCE
jgi:hypothetical protein